MQNNTHIGIQFSGIPLYKFKNGVSVVQLEPKDIPALEKMERELKENTFPLPGFPDTNISDHRELSEFAVTDIIDTLKLERDHQYKTNATLLMAVHNKRPVGVLGGNFLKLLNGSDEMTYSVYDKSGKKEAAELDWLMSFPYSKEIKKIGTALFSTFIKIAGQNKGFKEMHISAAIPRKSFAVKYYESLGFKKTGPTKDWIQADSPRHLLFFTKEKFVEDDVQAQPMAQKMKPTLKMAKDFQNEWVTKTYKKRSLNPENYLANYFKPESKA